MEKHMPSSEFKKINEISVEMGKFQYQKEPEIYRRDIILF